MKIDKFELDSYGNLKITTAYSGLKYSVYEYDCVPKEVLIKFITAKTEPSLEDFDGWLRDYKNKKKDNKDITLVHESFWSKK